MKALLVTMGTYGDMHPYVGLGLRLKSRGHEVVVISNQHFETLFSAHGLTFIGLKSSGDFQEYISSPDLCDPIKALMTAGKWCTLEPIRETYKIIADFYEPGNTVIACRNFVFAARIANEKLGAPLATILLCPNEMRSLYSTPVFPKPMALNDWVPKFSKRLQFWIMDRFFADAFLGPTTNSFRSELGLPAVSRFYDKWYYSPDRIIAFYPDWYSPYQPDWPKQMVLTGFPLWDPAATLDKHSEIFSFIRRGEPPIVFTPGSYNRHAGHFLRAAVECCETLGRRGVLLTKYREHLPEKLPSDVVHCDYAPLESLLPYTAALVSHGGIGTVAQALAAGVPQILMPITFNQPDDAARLKRLGVADFIPPKKFKGSLLTKKMGQLLSSESVAERCRDLAGRFNGVDPIGRACELLEELKGIDLKRKVPCL
ncbi:MAG: glycosyltransferase [Geobacteraceae bacterium]|nr:glycosyltransferase [Geobacteraceae bacterium]